MFLDDMMRMENIARLIGLLEETVAELGLLADMGLDDSTVKRMKKNGKAMLKLATASPLELFREDSKKLALEGWKDAETLVETLWVGGLLYSEEISTIISVVLRDAGEEAMILGVLDSVEPPFGLSWKEYFSSKYDIYYRVYEKAGLECCFAPKGQALLREKAIGIKAREEFFDSFLSWWDSKDTLSSADLLEHLSAFPGADRRVEILRQLAREDENMLGAYSTFDPTRLIESLVEEIREDYYGGVYVPFGENEAMYLCIVPQLRKNWKESR